MALQASFVGHIGGGYVDVQCHAIELAGKKETASLTIQTGELAISLAGFTRPQLQRLWEAVRKAEVQLDMAERQAARSRCAKVCPPVGSIVETLNGKRGVVSISCGLHGEYPIVTTEDGVVMAWTPNNYVTISEPNADGSLDAELAE